MFLRRFSVLLVSAAAAFGVWNSLPGKPWDRIAFTAVASSFSNPPLFVEGHGSHAEPWRLRSFSMEKKPDPRQAPVIVSLTDDLQGFFQSSPPAPIDFAVIFSNFQRLGAKKVATSAVLAWENPDPIGFVALERSMGGFDSLVLAAPLSRGAVATPIPPSFRRASIPVSAVQGDVSALPVVNRVPLPNIVLGGENAHAGFSVLEAEAHTPLLPLMAKWDDRLVFSFAFVTVIQRLKINLKELEIRPGEFLRFGAHGPVLPIDIYGRLATPLKSVAPYAEISAEALIDGGDDLFPKEAPDPVILRDDQSAAEPSTRAFSQQISAAIATLAADDSLAKSRTYPRLPQAWELGILSGVVLLLAWLGAATAFPRQVGLLVIAGFVLAAQWIGLGMTSIWLPGLPSLAAILAAGFFCEMLPSPKPKPASLAKPVISEEPAAAPRIPDTTEIPVTPIVPISPPKKPAKPKSRRSKKSRGKS